MIKELTEKEMRNTPALIKYTKISIYVPLVILILSFCSSIYFLDWGLFSRSGALIVIIGVYIAFKDFSGDIYHSMLEDKVTYENILLLINMDDKSRVEEIVRLENNKNISHKNMRKFTKYASKKFNNIELTLIIGGTFLWGYGDLIMNALWKLNA